MVTVVYSSSSRIIFEKGWMRASIDLVWFASEAGQEAVLAHPLRPAAAFSALACLKLRAALFSLGWWTWFWCRSFFVFGVLTVFRSASYCLNHAWNRRSPTPRHDLLTLWYIVLSKIGKSDFNELKCWTCAIRNWGDDLSRSGSLSRAGATKGLVSITGCFDLRGARDGRGRAGFDTILGSRTGGFRNFSCRVFTMGCNSTMSSTFFFLSDFTGSRFTIHFIIDPDFGSGLLFFFMCVLSAPVFPHRLKHRGHWNCLFDI